MAETVLGNGDNVSAEASVDMFAPELTEFVLRDAPVVNRVFILAASIFDVFHNPITVGGLQTVHIDICASNVHACPEFALTFKQHGRYAFRDVHVARSDNYTIDSILVAGSLPNSSLTRVILDTAFNFESLPISCSSSQTPNAEGNACLRSRAVLGLTRTTGPL